jgi:hypothetical protein
MTLFRLWLALLAIAVLVIALMGMLAIRAGSRQVVSHPVAEGGSASSA